MKCEDYELMIESYILGELSEDEIQILQAHLEDCESCHSLCQDLPEENLKLKSFFKIDHLPNDFSEQVVEQAFSENPFSMKKWMILSFGAGFAAAAILAVSLLPHYINSIIEKKMNVVAKTPEPTPIRSNDNTPKQDRLTPEIKTPRKEIKLVSTNDNNQVAQSKQELNKLIPFVELMAMDMEYKEKLEIVKAAPWFYRRDIYMEVLDDGSFAPESIRLLGDLKDRNAFHLVSKAAHSENKELYCEAIVAFGKLKQERAVNVLYEFIETNKEPKLCMEALAEIWSFKSRLILFNLIDEKEYSDNAIQVLGKFSDRSVPYLKKLSLSGRRSENKASRILELISTHDEEIKQIEF